MLTIHIFAGEWENRQLSSTLRFLFLIGVSLLLFILLSYLSSLTVPCYFCSDGSFKDVN